MSTRSPRGTSSPGTGSTDFGTGTLSPVRAASSISSVAATSRRPSAGILSPASKETTSPGTSSSDGMSIREPPRWACALITSIFWSAATLSAAFPSWFRPRIAFSTVIPRIARPVPNSWSATTLTIAAPTSTSCIRSRYWRRNECQPGSFASSASLFGPYCARRFSTSPASSPDFGSTPSWALDVLRREAVPDGLVAVRARRLGGGGAHRASALAAGSAPCAPTSSPR